MHSIYKILELTEAGGSSASSGASGGSPAPSGSTANSLSNKIIKGVSSVAKNVAKGSAKVALASIGGSKLDSMYGISNKVGDVAQKTTSTSGKLAAKLSTTSGRGELEGVAREKFNRILNKFKDLDKNSMKKYFVTCRMWKDYGAANRNATRNIMEYRSKAAIEAKSTKEAIDKAVTILREEVKKLKDTVAPDGDRIVDPVFIDIVKNKTQRFNSGVWSVSYIDRNGQSLSMKVQLDKNKLTYMTGDDEYYENVENVFNFFKQKYADKGFIPIKTSIKLVESIESEDNMNKIDRFNEILSESRFQTTTDTEKMAIVLYSKLRQLNKVTINGQVIKLVGLNDRGMLTSMKFDLGDNKTTRAVYLDIQSLMKQTQTFTPDVVNQLNTLVESMIQELPSVSEYPSMLDVSDKVDLDSDEIFNDEDKLYFSLEYTTEIFESIMLFLKLMYQGLRRNIPVNEIIVNRVAYDEFIELFEAYILEPLEEYAENKEVHEILSERFFYRFDDLLSQIEKVEKLESLTFGFKLSEIWNFLEVSYNLMLPLMQKIVSESSFDFSDVILDLKAFIEEPFEYRDTDVEYTYDLIDYVNTRA